jgi:hypothetical protein
MDITGLYTETRKICDTDTLGYSDADILRRINSAYEEVIGKLIASDTNWLWGDTNFTSLPSGTANLVAGTQAYSLSTALTAWLTIQSVKVKDVNGIWVELTRRDLKDLQPIEEYQKTNGMPSEYAVREDFVLLFPAPAAANVTTANGLQIVYQRTADVFTVAQVTTGTKAPGFASPYHILLAYKTALPYCVSYKKDRVPAIINEINRLEKDLLSFYGKRDKDTTRFKGLTMAGITYR